MPPRHSYSDGRGPDASSIELPVGLQEAARQMGWEPHLRLWAYARHLAGPDHTWVDRKALHAFIAKHRLFSRSRVNELLREGDGVFWDLRRGKRDGRRILWLKGIKNLVAFLRDGTTTRLVACAARVPVKELSRGALRARAAAFGALVGREAAESKPQARRSISLSLGVPQGTQRRWKVGTRQRAAFEDLGPITHGYQMHYAPEALPHPALRLLKLGATVHMVHQLGNVIETSFPSFRKRSLVYAIRGARHQLCYAERESGAPVRYVSEEPLRRGKSQWGKMIGRLLEKGLEPLVRKRTLEGKGICVYGYV